MSARASARRSGSPIRRRRCPARCAGWASRSRPAPPPAARPCRPGRLASDDPAQPADRHRDCQGPGRRPSRRDQTPPPVTARRAPARRRRTRASDRCAESRIGDASSAAAGRRTASRFTPCRHGHAASRDRARPRTLRPHHRDLDREAGADAALGPDLDRAAHHLAEALGQREAEAGAAELAGGVVLRLPEVLENAPQAFRARCRCRCR